MKSGGFFCKWYNLDPLADALLSATARDARGTASNHGDPVHLWNGLGTGYTMDGFRKAGKATMMQELKPGMKVKLTRRIPLRSGVSTETKKAGYVKYLKLKSDIAKKKCCKTVKGNVVMWKGRKVVIQDVITTWNGNVWIKIKIGRGYLPIVVGGKCRVTKV